MRFGWIAIGALSIACTSSDAAPPAPAPASPSDPAAPPPLASSGASPIASPAAPSAAAPGPLRVQFLGVDGFLVTYGGEAVLSAPLYTRPSMLDVSVGLVDADPGAVDAHLPASMLADVRAVLAGHAHYDHLLDVPTVLDRAPNARLYSNVSARNLLAAYAPDRAARCAGAPVPSFSIPRSRVVALDDAAASTVDYRLCPDERPAGAPLEGTWVTVPGSHVRVLALCSEHPAQIGPVHYGEGDVTDEACTPPERMDAWKEGRTLAFLVDFLDPATGDPVYRFYYQDAPTNAPIGHVPAPVLAGKRIDVALLCIGSYDHVENAPTATIDALVPRYAIGGHWEDFFQPADDPPQPIPLLDVDAWGTRARAAIANVAEPKPLVRNGQPTTTRAVVASPHDTFDVTR